MNLQKEISDLSRFGFNRKPHNCHVSVVGQLQIAAKKGDLFKTFKHENPTKDQEKTFDKKTRLKTV